MTVLGCKLCQRFISVSHCPEGNPVALEDPEKWSIIFAECQKCGAYICDRCIGNSRECPVCGSVVKIHRPGDGFAAEFDQRFQEGFREIAGRSTDRRPFFSRLFRRS